jgi:carbon storage regulator
MLVLSRSLGEEIVIGGHIRVVVLAIKRQHIRLGICAPQSVSVDRKEVHERRTAEWSMDGCDQTPPAEVIAKRSAGAARRRPAWLPQPSVEE